METRPSMRQWLCVEKLKVCCETDHYGSDCKPCAGHCSGPGPKACAKCEKGYEMNTEHGCMDIDECIVSKPCTKDKFCVNTEGTFKCMACDKSCDGCDSDGPDNCLACAEGFQLNKKKVCVTDKAAEDEKMKDAQDAVTEEETDAASTESKDKDEL